MLRNRVGELSAPIRLLSTLVLGAGTVYAGLLYVKVSRRRKKTRKREDWQRSLAAEAASELTAMGFEILSSEHEEEAVALITRSFSGSALAVPFPVYDRLYGPELAGKFENPLRINAIENSMLGHVRNALVNGGVAFSVRVGDQLEAVCLAYPYLIAEDGSRGGHLGNPIAVPPWPLLDETKYGKLPKIRGLWFARGEHNFMDRMHDANAPGAHWYIGILAVDPSAQGRGHARRMLEAVHILADRAKVPCYLDTVGERLRSVYERLGYKVAGGRGYELNIPEDPNPIKDPTLESGIMKHYGMLRFNA